MLDCCSSCGCGANQRTIIGHGDQKLGMQGRCLRGPSSEGQMEEQCTVLDGAVQHLS